MNGTRRTVLAAAGASLGGLSIGGVTKDRSLLPGRLVRLWTSDTDTTYTQNHHAFSTVVANESPVIAVPRNNIDGSTTCGVVGIDASGDVLWEQTIPPEKCDPHALGDMGVGFFTQRRTPEFLVGTEPDVFVLDALTGKRVFNRNALATISYSAPAVVQIPDSPPQLVVIDFAGNLSVLTPNGSVAWEKDLQQPVFVSPIVADVTQNGHPNILVNHGRRPSDVVCYDETGHGVWRQSLPDSVSSWTLTTSSNPPRIIAAVDDTIVLLDGLSGTIEWTRPIGRNPAVGPVNNDSVYVTVRDGTLRSVSIASGSVDWRSRVTQDSGYIPSPILGTITDRSTESIVTAARNGTISVLTAESGDLLAQEHLSATIYTPPQLLDITRDGTQDIILMTGAAHVIAFSLELPN